MIFGCCLLPNQSIQGSSLPPSWWGMHRVQMHLWIGWGSYAVLGSLRPWEVHYVLGATHMDMKNTVVFLKAMLWQQGASRTKLMEWSNLVQLQFFCRAKVCHVFFKGRGGFTTFKISYFTQIILQVCFPGFVGLCLWWALCLWTTTFITSFPTCPDDVALPENHSP